MKDLNNKEYRLILSREDWADRDILETNCPTVALDAKDKWEARGFTVTLYRVTYEVIS